MSRSKIFRFAVLVSELIAAELVEYKTAILCFVNCLILGTEEIWIRHSIRSELINLGLLDEIDCLKTSTSPELIIQIQVFEHHRSKDEDHLDVAEEKSLFENFCDFFMKVCYINKISLYNIC